MPKPSGSQAPQAPRGQARGFRVEAGALPAYFLKASLTMCLFIVAALACFHLILASAGS